MLPIQQEKKYLGQNQAKKNGTRDDKHLVKKHFTLLKIGPTFPFQWTKTRFGSTSSTAPIPCTSHSSWHLK